MTDAPLTLYDYRMRDLGMELPEDYATAVGFVLLHLKPVTSLKLAGRTYQALDPYAMPFGEVVILQRLASQDSIQSHLEAISLVFRRQARTLRGTREQRAPISALAKLRSTQFFPAWNYIRARLKFIAEMKEKAVINEPDALLIAAGVDRLKIFKEAAVIDALADGDLLRWQAVQEQPYNIVLMKLSMESIRADIRKKWRELNKQKNKLR